MTPPGVKILIADDSASDRAAARGILSDAGYTVVEATDGQQVLEAFNRERPALVVLDVVMPRIGGLSRSVASSRPRPRGTCRCSWSAPATRSTI